MVRHCTAVLNTRPDTNAFWLLPSLPPSVGPTRTDVLRVVLNTFPIPSDDVSFRLYHDSHVKRSRLINWINEMGRAALSDAEINDKLETVLKDYSEHMRLHEIKVAAAFWKPSWSLRPNLQRTSLRLSGESSQKDYST